MGIRLPPNGTRRSSAPISVTCRAWPPPLTSHHTTARPLDSSRLARTCTGSRQHIMEVSGSLQHHHYLGDSFSYGWLTQAPPQMAVADAGHAFGSSRSSYIDMDDAELFSMRWTTTSDFDFGLPVPGSGATPAQLVSASQIFRGGRLLPCEPGACSNSAAQQVVDDDSVTRHAAKAVPAPLRRSAPSSPLFHSAQSTPVSLSACSSATSNRPTRRGRGGSSPWKVLLRYVRFLMPLYRKARALGPPRRHNHNRVAPAAGSPGRGSTSSSVEWCHGSVDTAVHDAILYCKKSSGQDALLLPIHDTPK